MGYRSDVRIVITKEGFEELKNFVNEYCKEHKCDNLLNMLDVDKLTSFTSDKLIGWNSVKWYEDTYENVIAINKGLAHMSNLEYAYNFSRIGEDFDDYEIEEKCDRDGNYVPNVYISRSFDDDWI